MIRLSEPPARADRGVVGVLLAGGRARRMGGGDKCLKEIDGRTLLDLVMARAAPQVERLILNAAGDPDRFARYGLPVEPDVVAGFAGPLAGVLTGLTWARRNAPACSWVASFATDTPFFPDDLVMRLKAAVEREDADMACAASAGRSHPVFALWPTRLADDLATALTREGVHKIDAWTSRYRLATVPFDFVTGGDVTVDPFFNVNAPEDLAVARTCLQAHFATGPGPAAP